MNVKNQFHVKEDCNKKKERDPVLILLVKSENVGANTEEAL